MIFPHTSRALQRHRVQDERGLHYNWNAPHWEHLRDAITTARHYQPDEHVPDAALALQDAFSTALHTAHSAQVTPDELLTRGPNDWTGQSVWLEFSVPQDFGGRTYEGALVYRVPLNAHGLHLILPVLMGRTLEWILPVILSGSLHDYLNEFTGTEPIDHARRAVLTALTHLPPLTGVPAQHEGNATLLARLEQHLLRTKTCAPATAAALPGLYLAHREEWNASTFVPSSITSALLSSKDHLDPDVARIIAPEISVITAWRYAKHVIRIDPDVLNRLRRARPMTRLPAELPGLRGHATYVPIPGGLTRPSQSGFFAAIDDVAGQPWLTILTEDRAYGENLLAPVLLPLGCNILEELRNMARNGQSNYTEEQAEHTARNLSFALLCVAYIGSTRTQLLGPGTPRPATPRRGRSGREELTEPGATPIWEAGKDTGDALRAYAARAAQTTTGTGTGTSTGRTMPPHLREPHLHGYWTGKNRSQYELKFLDFIPVNMHADGPETPVRLL